MLISVIIPVFNKIEIIEECIKLNMLHANQSCEWIIIDNNSDAPTKEGLMKIELYANNLGHACHIITEPKNTGVAVAWNTGLKLATCNYICVLNNDCVMMPGWDEALVRFNENKNLCGIISPLIVEQGDLNTSYNYTLDSFLQGNENWEYLLKKNHNRFREGYFSGIVLFAKKHVFDLIGAFDEKFWLSMEDMDYLYRVQKEGFVSGITGECTAFHFSSLTRKSVNHDESANHEIFKIKWNWSFVNEESRWFNKLIRKWQKRSWKYFHVLSEWKQRFPQNTNN